MKITMEQCISALNSFNKLAETQLPFKQTFIVAKNIKALEEVVSPFEDSRNKYVKRLQQTSYTDDSGKVVVPDEAAEKFKEDVAALLNQSVSVDISNITLSESEFPEIKANDIKGCVDFIKLT